MGLDMYLTGHKFIWTDHKNPKNNPIEDGYRVKVRELELGYWRKHPDLHGYIVDTFAGGNDDCQRIDLDEKALEKIIDAIENDELPSGVTGFVFGQSGPEDKDPSLEILRAALKWLKAPDKKCSRSVYYQASW